MWLGSSLFTIALFVVAIIVISRAIRVVPQQHALVIERLGRFFAVLQPGLNFVIPFVDRVAYRGSTWDAELAAPDVRRADTLYIVAMRGSVLLLSDRKPAP